MNQWDSRLVNSTNLGTSQLFETFRLATASLCYLITYLCSGGEMAQISTPDREQEPRLPLTTHLRQDHSTDVWAISPPRHQYAIKWSQMNIYIWLRPSQVFTSLKMFSQIFRSKNGMKWIGFKRPDEWDDTALETHSSKFEPWWSESEHVTSRSRRLYTKLNIYNEKGRNI